MANWNSKTIYNLLQELFESNSFTEIERKIAEFIYLTVQTEIEDDKPLLNGNGTENDNDNIELVRSNLKRIVDCLNECISSRKKFLGNFPNWRTARIKNIQSLRKIAEEINADRSNCNISKLVGSSVSIVGGSMCVAAAILAIVAPPTLAITVPVGIAGGVTTGLGGSTTFGTSITEISLLKMRVNQAKDILKEDKETFESMQEWVSSGRVLVEAINVVMKFEVARKISNDIVNFLQSVFDPSFLLKEKQALSEFLKNVVTKHFRSALGLLIPPMACIIFPFIISVLFVSILMHKECPFIFDSVVFTLRIVGGLCASFDIGADAATLIVSSLRNGAEVSASVGRFVARGAIAAFGVALDVANIILTSIDVHNGSVSEQAANIIVVADEMQKELDMLQQIYTELESEKSTPMLDNCLTSE